VSAANQSSERPATTPDGPAAARSLTGPRLVGAVLLLLGIAVLAGAVGIAQGTGFRPVGPGFVPIVIGAGLVVLSIAFLARTTLRPDIWLAERAAEEERATSWPTVGGLAVLLAVYAFALNPVGYIIATALLVPSVARLIGSRRILRDAVVGVAIALGVWFGFTEFLGVRLPAGLLGPIL
jgi:putative tricarboxylic transport membrane protein